MITMLRPQNLEAPVSRNRHAIEIIGVSKRFEGTRGRDAVPVLSTIDLAVDEGEFIAIIGPSGCGKSTLLSILAGYTTLEEGAIRIDGQPAMGPGSDRVMVFQRPTLFPWLSAKENIAFGLRLKANRTDGEKAIRDAAMNLLDLVGLAQFASHYPFELSGGMQQRVEIARALAVRPKVLLMDEPFGALDALTRRSMQDELTQIHAKTGCTTLLVTHDVNEAIVLADRVVVMTHRPGRIKAVIPIDLARAERRGSVGAMHLARRMDNLLTEDYVE
jgi:NitT/TauT family transport system ATP-binding protein